jgi:hypothetical protein
MVSFRLFPGNLLNDFFSFVIEFAIPFGIINYFLIFYRDRYKKILERYSAPKRKYAFIYSITVTLFALFSAFVYNIFK